MELEVGRPRRESCASASTPISPSGSCSRYSRTPAATARVASGSRSTARTRVVVYAIEDDGPGVAGVEHDRIFEPGVRGRAPREGGGQGGAGLGLALARRLARSVDGDVVADAAAPAAASSIRLPTG